ncbi:MAG: NAD(P)/FAD-dependent oxidoreductase [Candidatus Heimdallarchaeota archaeon]|nr:NAD(P)/FAD-dependent oxidoreductase [Candidatus Heimdallarchaeota archaeon]
MKETYDVIIIGAGMGGLHAGIYLQSNNPSISSIILEKNDYPGGYVSGFSNDGFYFDSAAESIMEYNKSKVRMELLKFGFNHPLHKVEPIETYYNKDKIVNLFSDEEKFLNEVKKYHPDQIEGLKALFKTSHEIRQNIIDCGLYDNNITIGKALKVLFKYPTLRKYAFKNFKQFLNEFISEEVMEYFNIFCLWFGLEFDEIDAPVGAVIISSSFKEGLFYPEGGMDTFARNMVKFYQSKGGTLQYNKKVKKILVKGKKVCGVELEDGSILKAKYVISNGDLHRTISDYINKEHLSKKYRKSIEETKKSISGFMLYLGVENLNLTEYPPHFIIGENTKIIPNVRENQICLKNIGVRIASNIDKGMKNGQKDSIQILGFADYKWNNNWETKGDGIRTKEYRQLKKNIIKILIERVESVIPNLSNHIKLKRLATPLTFERFNLSSKGAFYGPAYNQKLPNFKTPIKNLFFAGSNVGGSGVNSAMSSGLKTGKFLLKKIDRDFLRGKYEFVVFSTNKSVQES